MTTDELNAWKRFMMQSAGHWTVDPIHDGVHRDLIAFVARPDDPEKGVYVAIGLDGSWHAGSFESAVPHICDGMMMPKTRGKADSYSAAVTHCVERLGLSFLLALTHGRSPYRGV